MNAGAQAGVRSLTFSLVAYPHWRTRVNKQQHVDGERVTRGTRGSEERKEPIPRRKLSCGATERGGQLDLLRSEEERQSLFSVRTTENHVFNEDLHGFVGGHTV